MYSIYIASFYHQLPYSLIISSSTTMGIYNAYKKIKPELLKPVNLSDYRGKRAAVDIMCW